MAGMEAGLGQHLPYKTANAEQVGGEQGGEFEFETHCDNDSTSGLYQSATNPHKLRPSQHLALMLSAPMASLQARHHQRCC